MFTYAITRKPGVDFADGLTQAGLGKPSYTRITEQHSAYVNALKQRQLQVVELEPLGEHPDAYFVEDPAVVTPDIAVITIPGAPSRQGEGDSLKQCLQQFREIAQIEPPGTVDGGDVLMVENHFFIGVSARTNAHGAHQLGRILERFGYNWTTITVQAGLHFKSDVNYIGNDTLLMTSRYSHVTQLNQFNKIILKDDEAYAANSLWLGDCLFMPQGFPEIKNRVERAGHHVIQLDVSEVRKMDGGLTCLSLRF